jgi:hypothetical protein
MIFKFLILFHFINIFGGYTAPKEDKIKAWIEIEGQLDALRIRAKIENTSQENIFLNYEIEMYNRSRIKNQRTLQKGKFLALKKSIIALSESRMNIRITEELCVQIKVFENNKVIAIDSVVFHPAK